MDVEYKVDIHELTDLANDNAEYIQHSFDRVRELINGHEIAIAVWPGGSMMIKRLDLVTAVEAESGGDEETTYTAIPCDEPQQAAMLKYLVDVGAISGSQEQIAAAMEAPDCMSALENNMQFIVSMPTAREQPHRHTTLH